MRVSELIGGPERWAWRLGAATVVGLTLGVIGPFGSYANDGAVARMAYWTVLLWAGVLVLGLTVAPAWRLAPSWRVPRPFAAGVATLIACVPMTGVVAAVSRAMWPRDVGAVRPLDLYARTVFVAGLLVAAAVWVEKLRRGAAERPEPAAQPTHVPAAASSAEQERLPSRLRDAAVCLQMEDHYVRVHTATGSELVLLPMQRAVDALGGRGLRVHRSWWVAREAVAAAESDGRAVTLLTRTGLRVPVARNRVAELRAAGWLDGAG